MSTIYTIGHSTRSYDEFLELLKLHDIQILVDVRSLPGSRKFPHFNQENLQQSLPQDQIQYQHYKDLGGRRPQQASSHNTLWRNLSFRNYADYMEMPEFAQAIEDLQEL